MKSLKISGNICIWYLWNFYTSKLKVYVFEIENKIAVLNSKLQRSFWRENKISWKSVFWWYKSCDCWSHFFENSDKVKIGICNLVFFENIEQVKLYLNWVFEFHQISIKFTIVQPGTNRSPITHMTDWCLVGIDARLVSDMWLIERIGHQ